MRRTAFDSARDQRIADETGVDRALMCCANGCPNRWSCDPPRACRWHAWAEPRLWPQITQEQIDAETDRARAAANGRAPARRLSVNEKVALLEGMRSLAVHGAAPAGPLAWAHRLKARQQAGEVLTATQREMMAAALRRASDHEGGIDV